MPEIKLTLKDIKNYPADSRPVKRSEDIDMSSFFDSVAKAFRRNNLGEHYHDSKPLKPSGPPIREMSNWELEKYKK